MKAFVFVGIASVCLWAQSSGLQEGEFVLVENSKGELARGQIKSVREGKCVVYLMEHRREMRAPVEKVVPIDRQGEVPEMGRVGVFLPGSKLGRWATVESSKGGQYRVRYFGERGEATAWVARERVYVPRKTGGKRGISVLAADGKGAKAEVKLY